MTKFSKDGSGIIRGSERRPVSAESKALHSLLAALRRLNPSDDWAGWENSEGVEVGKRLVRAIRQATAALQKREP